jgi:hypothetical protein
MVGCMYKVQIACVGSLRNAQVRFEFGYGPLNFDRVIPLEIRKKLKFSVSDL